jgi:hypothetical protein
MNLSRQAQAGEVTMKEWRQRKAQEWGIHEAHVYRLMATGEIEKPEITRQLNKRVIFVKDEQ